MRISIIMPIYNREKFLSKALETVYGQSYRPLELLLVDNGSADSSLSICEEFRNRYSKSDFTVIVLQEKKTGANAARNKGLENASGDYVSFFDSDDEMNPVRMQLIAQKIDKTGADIIASVSMMRRKDGGCFLRNTLYSDTVEDQILAGMLSTQNFTVKTDYILSLGGWDESIFRWQDWELGIRLLMNTSKVAWIKDIPLDYINTHLDSITGNDFGSSYTHLTHAIDCATMVIENTVYCRVRKERLLAYLCYRRIWLAGLLYREKRWNENRDCLYKAKQMMPSSFYVRTLFACLYIYIKYGGRGAWKIVRTLLR